MSPREVSVAEHERWREALAHPERWLEPDDHLTLLDTPPQLLPEPGGVDEEVSE